MKAKQAKAEFKRTIASANRRVGSLSPADGLGLVTAFYRDVRAEDVARLPDKDMLLYQWGTYDWGEGAHFELDLTRQLILGSGEDDHIWQLHLTFYFPPEPALQQLGKGDRWCESVEAVPEFVAFVRSTPAFQAVAARTDGGPVLEYERAG
ncbi:MAG: hypothetical protein WCC53_05870 [Thermoanaerobaculia bacterium]